MTQNDLFGPQSALPQPSRKAGLERLTGFTPSMGRRYAATRNHDFGPDDRSNVSALSAHVRHRLITEAELVSAAINAHGLEAAEKFIQEVCWRTYWKGWLEARPSVWRDYTAGLSRDLKLLNRDGDLRSRYDAAVAGETGLECFDVWARELIETGYLHNHARMWFASIWIYTLNLPWRLGADVFFRHLVDGDAASNTLGWRWVGGQHTADKTYLARASNITKYSGGRFQMQGYALASEAPPLGDPDHPAPLSLPLSENPDRDAKTLILVHDEDGLADDGVFDSLNIVGVASLPSYAARSILPIGECAKAFTDAALDDALSRSCAHFNVSSQALRSPQELIHAAQHFGAVQVVTARPHVGPLADQMTALGPQLKAVDLSLKRVKRDWDNVFHPHADRGFFKLKKAIPKALSRLNILPDTSSAA
jgi:deoxyribodipyrimidine photo-lyase